MTNRDRIKIIKELKEWPISTIDKKFEQVEESLNWAIKVCEKFENKREAKNKWVM